MRAYVAHLTFNRITQIENVERFTPHYVYFATAPCTPTRLARTDDHQHYAPTWAEARAALVTAANHRIAQARQDLAVAQRDRAAAEAMRMPDDAEPEPLLD